LETVSSSTNAFQDVASVDEFLNVVAIETVPLLEHLSFEFLRDYDVFAPASRGRTRTHQPPDLFCGFLHCYYEDVYGTRLVITGFALSFSRLIKYPPFLRVS
jgi:hypothetical protein